MKYTGSTKVVFTDDLDHFKTSFGNSVKLPTIDNKSSYIAGVFIGTYNEFADDPDHPSFGNIYSLDFRYISPDGKEEEASSFYLYSVVKYASGLDGLNIASFLGDKRFGSNNPYTDILYGIHTKKTNEIFYPDEYIKNKSFVCTDSATYSILI